MKWSLSINFNKQTQIYTFTNLHIDRLAFCQRYIVQVYRYRSKKCLGVCVWGGGVSNINDINTPPTHQHKVRYVNARSPINLDFRSAKKGGGGAFLQTMENSGVDTPAPPLYVSVCCM